MTRQQRHHQSYAMVSNVRSSSWIILSFLLLSLNNEIRFSSGLSMSTTPLPKTTSTPTTSATPKQRVVVVGGGVGGLAVASRIASTSQHNLEVILLEKNSKEMIGGRCGSFDVSIPNVGTFRHERGPSLLLLKSVYEDLFRDCSPSSKLANHYGLDMRQCIPAYQVVFDDGEAIDLGFPIQIRGGGIEPSTAEIEEKISRTKMNEWEENGAKKWDEYMRSTSAFLDCGLPNFIEERLDLVSFPAFIVEALRDGAKSWPLKPHSDVLDATFSSNKMRALASFQNLYVGLEPYKNKRQIFGGVLQKTAPAVFGLLAALELHPTNSKAGVFAPIGGFRSVGNAFQALAEDCGVQFQYQKTVTKVTSQGVYMMDTPETLSTTERSEEEFISADLVIVNADLPFATKTLLDSKESESGTTTMPVARYDWEDKFDYSSGVVAFHWSIDKKLTGLNTHNVFLCANSREEAEQSWSVLRDDGLKKSPKNMQKSDPFNFYVHRAGKTDPTAAPDGCDAIMILVPCKALLRNEDLAKLPREEAIEKYKEQFDDECISCMRDAVLERLSVVVDGDENSDIMKNLRQHILHEVIDTPGTYADYYNVGAGVPFGLSHGFGQLSLTRPAAQSKDIDNVLFVGASSRPGNGVPLVLLGAKSVAETALEKIKNKIEQ